MTWIFCPCLGCSYQVGIDEFPYHDNLDKALERMNKHLWKDHSIDDIQEWTERMMVKHFQKLLKEATK